MSLEECITVRDRYSSKGQFTEPDNTDEETTIQDHDGSTSIGMNFLFDGDDGILYSKEGKLLVDNVDWIKPIKGHPRKAVVGVDSSIFGSYRSVNEYEIVTNDEGELVASYRIKNSDRQISERCDVDSTEAIEFLTLPEYNAFIEKMSDIQESDRPSWQLTSGQWIWYEDIREDDVQCSSYDCCEDACIRVHSEQGRVLGSIRWFSDRTENHYCRYCMYLEPNAKDLIEYYNPFESEVSENEISEMYDSEEDGFRLIAEDTRNNYSLVISVSDTGNSKNGKNEYITTVELVRDSPTGSLVDREIPTIHKNNPEEAAKRGLELYESFWSGQYGDLEFEVIKSKILSN